MALAYTDKYVFLDGSFASFYHPEIQMNFEQNEKLIFYSICATIYAALFSIISKFCCLNLILANAARIVQFVIIHN